jgi:UDP-N-acetylglucosamine 1-carboxyvinyltransferase
MDKYVINGKQRLCGKVKISGSKNAALPIMAATLLTSETCIINRVPDLKDVRTMIRVLEVCGKTIVFKNNTLTITQEGDLDPIAPYNIVKTMRGAICVLGPLIAKSGYARVSLPGGCAIGPRPVDLHIKGMEALGAKINIEHGYIIADAKELVGTNTHLVSPSGTTVLGTDNVMSAATLARGKTIINSAALEPECADVGNFLVAMGADIEGIGTPVISVNGVKELFGCEYDIIPDRIETGTFMVMAAATGGDITIEDTCPEHVETLTKVLRDIGVNVEIDNTTIRVYSDKNLTCAEIETLPYPDFPTDLQPQLMTLLSLSQGISVISETIFPDRFIHVSELNRMGASIKVEDTSAIIHGVESLSGAEVMASDLRAGAALVIAGLAAEGKTCVHRIYHIDRGYEDFEEKVRALGGNISRTKES